MTELIEGSIASIRDIMNTNSKKPLNEKEIKVGNALIELFENWEDILIYDGSNKLNKSNILYYLRETTRLTTKEIRDSMKKYKNAYISLKEQIMRDL
jgi:hypothetical protein